VLKVKVELPDGTKLEIETNHDVSAEFIIEIVSKLRRQSCKGIQKETKTEPLSEDNNVPESHRSIQAYANNRKSGKEQYYTESPVADLCVQEVMKHVPMNRMFLEPAGGTGEFIEALIRQGVEPSKILSYDIEPKHSLVKEQDFLEMDKEHIPEGAVCVTNPPFGRASSLAKKFFDACADKCDYICFLVPRSWRKWSVIDSLDDRFHLVSDIDLPSNCFYLADGSKKAKSTLKTTFQVWKKSSVKRKKINVKDHGLVKKVKHDEKIFKDANGEVERVERTVTGADCEFILFGFSCGKVKRLTRSAKYKYKTTSAYFKAEPEVIDALEKIDFSCFYNNVAYVEALSMKEVNYKLNEFFGLPQE